MTTLLFVKDYIRQKLGADDITFNFDEDNLTNEEEILQEQSIEQVYLKIVRSPKFGAAAIGDSLQQNEVIHHNQYHIFSSDQKSDGGADGNEEQIYVNAKNQLVKITPVERNGRMTELHQILSFDVDKLPQSTQHTYGGEDPSKLTSIPRAKVPVKDGMS